MCSESPRGSLADMLGLGSLAAHLGYLVTRGAAEGLLTEVEERALYSRFGL